MKTSLKRVTLARAFDVARSQALLLLSILEGGDHLQGQILPRRVVHVPIERQRFIRRLGGLAGSSDPARLVEETPGIQNTCLLACLLGVVLAATSAFWCRKTLGWVPSAAVN